jgi:hypothetical protein
MCLNCLQKAFLKNDEQKNKRPKFEFILGMDP